MLDEIENLLTLSDVMAEGALVVAQHILHLAQHLIEAIACIVSKFRQSYTPPCGANSCLRSLVLSRSFKSWSSSDTTEELESQEK